MEKREARVALGVSRNVNQIIGLPVEMSGRQIEQLCWRGKALAWWKSGLRMDWIEKSRSIGGQSGILGVAWMPAFGGKIASGSQYLLGQTRCGID
jgi:hypothetical protein